MSGDSTSLSRHGIGPRRTSPPATEPHSGHENATSEASGPKIIDRPALGRTAPVRASTSLPHTDPGTEPFHRRTESFAVAPDSSDSRALEANTALGAGDDAGSVVPIAYQVIDKYVDDGQKAAQNWTHAGDARSTPRGHDTPESQSTTRAPDKRPAADHLISEAIAALVSSRGLASAASALPAILAALTPEDRTSSTLQALVRAAQQVLGTAQVRAGELKSLIDSPQDARADLWTRLGGGPPNRAGEDGIPVSTTGWLPGSHGD